MCSWVFFLVLCDLTLAISTEFKLSSLSISSPVFLVWLFLKWPSFQPDLRMCTVSRCLWVGTAARWPSLHFPAAIPVKPFPASLCYLRPPHHVAWQGFSRGLEVLSTEKYWFSGGIP